MQKKIRKSFILLFSAVIAVLLFGCAFMLAPKTTAHADTEETHDHLTMTAINSYADIENGELTTGAYVLTDNIDGNLTVTGEVTICLNGHTLTGIGTGSVITVKEGAKLTLCDCVGTGVITGGTGNTDEMSDFTNGGGVCVYGSFIMYGGTISNNSASFGGGVFVEGGTFTMYGGTIELNTAENSGGGVCVVGEDSTFTMYDGTISSNEAMISGGVYVNVSTFTMIDGMINGNTGTYAVGGVLVLGTFKISGGDIIGNEQTNDIGFGTCGGVCVGLPMIADEDVEIVFEISGAPLIMSNKVMIDGNAVENNVVLDEGYKITVAGELTFGAIISVNNTGAVATGFTQDDKPVYFMSDDETNNCIFVEDGTVTIGTHDIITHEAQQPTCTENGWQAYESCSHCDYSTDKVEISALGHNEVSDNNAVAPTCTLTGLTASKSCSVCNTVLSEQTTVPALGHNEVSDNNAVVPTCTLTGLTASKSCSVCNTVLSEQTTVPALGHNEVSDNNAVAPTCTLTGLTASKSCSVCNTVLSEQTTVPALGHKYGDWVTTKEATESEDGEQRRVCENDEAHYETRTLPKLTPSTPTPEKPSAPTEETKSYWWLFWLLIPLAIGVGGVTLGIWVYKNDKKNNRK